EPRPRRRAPRVEPPPRTERLLERLRREVLRQRAVSRQENEVAVDGVELALRNVGEARGSGAKRAGVGCRGVHVGRYAAEIPDVTPDCLAGPRRRGTVRPGLV